jgi:tetratricopeptide (TPR) repeat protein
VASQKASLELDEGAPQEALATLTPALEFFKGHKYRTYEITALHIASRAYQRLDDLPKAHEIATVALKEAEVTRDERQVALALGNLAAQATVLGSLPEALALRERVETIHVRQKSVASLPFDLTNRAELLIRLGRPDGAEAALQQVDAGIQQKIDVYIQRQRRVTFLRALRAVIGNRFEEAATIARSIAPEPGSADSASVLGSAILEYADVKQRARRKAPGVKPIPPASSDPGLERERHYWRMATALAGGHPGEALTGITSALEQASRIRNDELQWRLAALGTVAARELGRPEDGRILRATGLDALTRLRVSWGRDAYEYEHRPDLTALRTAAGL